eukprot:PhM_4_TR14364/c0_g1_i1/m.41729
MSFYVPLHPYFFDSFISIVLRFRTKLLEVVPVAVSVKRGDVRCGHAQTVNLTEIAVRLLHVAHGLRDGGTGGEHLVHAEVRVAVDDVIQDLHRSLLIALLCLGDGETELGAVDLLEHEIDRKALLFSEVLVAAGDTRGDALVRCVDVVEQTDEGGVLGADGGGRGLAHRADKDGQSVGALGTLQNFLSLSDVVALAALGKGVDLADDAAEVRAVLAGDVGTELLHALLQRDGGIAIPVLMGLDVNLEWAGEAVVVHLAEGEHTDDGLRLVLAQLAEAVRACVLLQAHRAVEVSEVRSVRLADCVCFEGLLRLVAAVVHASEP